MAAGGARAAGAKLPTIGFLGAARLRVGAHGRPLLCSGCANSAGSRAAQSRSSIAGRRDAAERYAEIAAEFVRLKVDVIVTWHRGVPAAKQATSVIPIVFAVVGDPVGTGFVASLARPGGNVTGLSLQQTDLAGKRLELLREVVPGLRRLAIMANVDYPAGVREMARSRQRPARLALMSRVGNPAGRGYRARLRGSQERADALYV